MTNDSLENTVIVLDEPNYIENISNDLGFKDSQIKTVLDLILEGSTVPFIARYRKESTGNLNEDDIRSIIDTKDKLEKIHKAKQTAINGIVELGKMTDDILENIKKASSLKEVEEIYKPYKSKKKTKAMIAIEKGFQVIADLIKTNDSNFLFGSDGSHKIEFTKLLGQYSKEEIIEGAMHIISAEISSNSDLRADLLETLQKYSNIISKIKTDKYLEKLNDKDKSQISKFDIYSDFTQRISFLKPYQILALNRGEDLGILNIKIEKTEKTYEGLQFHYARILGVRVPFIDALEKSFKDGYNNLFKSVENELRSILNDLAQDDAIQTFKQNLSSLLMTKPEYGQKILAIDPGFSAGCKIAILDEIGNPVSFDKIFLHKKLDSISKLKDLIKNNNPGVIVVGNGTGVNETIEILHNITDVEIFIVNESGASVYSASKIAKEEFPELDSLDRGTVSIGRRFIDPLSELVKVPVGSIGVGMYQHDLPEKKLKEKLLQVVEDTVNDVGINVNSASSYVLNHISGIDKRTAKKIYNNRPYQSRLSLKKQLSDKVYEQSVGFLRVPDSSNILDNTDIHPEQYELAEYIIKNFIGNKELSSFSGSEKSPNTSLSGSEKSPHPNPLPRGEGVELFFNENEIELRNIYPDVGVTTINFIIDSYNNIGKDKRVNSTHKKSIKKGTVELKQGDIVDGVVRNVVAFGAFVDIGMKNDGLVHVSEIADKFVIDPKEEVEVGQTVKVKITAIDNKTGKIQLSMKNVL